MKKRFEVMMILPLTFFCFSLLVAQSNEELFVMADLATNPIDASENDAFVQGPSLFEVLKADPNLSVFATALKASGIAEKLDGTQYTIFAPSNDAFAALDEGTVENLLMPENKEQLISIIKNHIISEVMPADQLSTQRSVNTWAGNKVEVNVGSAGVFCWGS